MKKTYYLACTLLALLFSCEEEAPGTDTSEPVAAFTFEVDKENPLTIHFTNSSENATGYIWDFGDDTGSSTDEDPAYTYSTVGEYTVSLTATGKSGSNKTSKTVTVTVTAPAGPEGCLLSQIKETYNDGETTTTLTYDDDGNITKIEYFDDDDESESIEFTYMEGQLVKAQFYEGSVPENEFITFSYDGDKFSKLSIAYDDDGLYESRFIYDGDEVVKVENWTDEYCYADDTLGDVCTTIEDLYLSEVYEFTYSNGNLVRIVEQDFTEDGVLEYRETHEITYDDKPNPLKGNLAWFIWEWDVEIYLSANNWLTDSEEYNSYDEEGNAEPANTETETLEYIYNEDGLPIKIQEIAPPGSVGGVSEYALTYECD